MILNKDRIDKIDVITKKIYMYEIQSAMQEFDELLAIMQSDNLDGRVKEYLPDIMGMLDAAIKNRDFVLFADVLNYELKRLFSDTQ